IRRLPQDLADQALQESAIAYVAQVHVADQRCLAPTPGIGQILQPYSGASDAGPASVPDSIQSERHGEREQNFYHPMKIDSNTGQCCNSEQQPGEECGQKQETQKAHPRGCALVEHAHWSAGVGEGQHRSSHKADRQQAKGRFQRERMAWYVMEGPCSVEKVMSEDQNELNDRDEGYESLSVAHDLLDSERVRRDS